MALEGVLLPAVPGGTAPCRGAVNVIVADPAVVTAAAVAWTLAFPWASVVAVVADKVIMLGLLLATVSTRPLTGFPPASVTVTVYTVVLFAVHTGLAALALFNPAAGAH